MKKTKTIENGTSLIQELIEWLIYAAGYTLVLILSVLNKTLKPILVTITMPLTGITFGLFYPFINVFLLKIVDWLLGSHFELHNIFILFFIAILISIMNYIVTKIVEKFLKKVKGKKVKKDE